VNTYQYWVNYNGGDTDEADKISARAGHSQHQLGTAIDFSTSSIGDVVGSAFTGTVPSYGWQRMHTSMVLY
jgi:D-alanyl-D-alanine carboxypeptidase